MLSMHQGFPFSIKNDCWIINFTRCFPWKKEMGSITNTHHPRNNKSNTSHKNNIVGMLDCILNQKYLQHVISENINNRNVQIHICNISILLSVTLSLQSHVELIVSLKLMHNPIKNKHNNTKLLKSRWIDVCNRNVLFLTNEKHIVFVLLWGKNVIVV